MADWTDYRGLQVPLDTPSGDAGRNLKSNFVSLADWGPKSNYTATTDPTADDDVSTDYYPGSFWLNASSNAFFICASNANGAAVWTPVAPAAYIFADNLDPLIINEAENRVAELDVAGSLVLNNKDGVANLISADDGITIEQQIRGPNAGGPLIVASDMEVDGDVAFNAVNVAANAVIIDGSGIKIGAGPVIPELPTSDGEYKLVIASGVATWVTI